jgi:hypothetical protein
LYPIGTKVAKQFDAAGGELVWFEGMVQRYDEEDGLYWVLYSDGDSEDMYETEVRDAVHNYRVHVQQQEEAVAEVETTAVGSDSLSASAEINDATVSLTKNEAVPAADVPAADSLQSSSILDASEIAVAMRAMTAAAEQLTSAAARIEVAVQQQRQSQQQQQQQQLPPWHLHRSWHHVVLQHQQQAYYQQQQQQQHIWNWQQWQQRQR